MNCLFFQKISDHAHIKWKLFFYHPSLKLSALKSSNVHKCLVFPPYFSTPQKNSNILMSVGRAGKKRNPIRNGTVEFSITILLKKVDKLEKNSGIADFLYWHNEKVGIWNQWKSEWIELWLVVLAFVTGTSELLR